MGALTFAGDIDEVAHVAPKVDVQSECAARSEQVSDGQRVAGEVKEGPEDGEQ